MAFFVVDFVKGVWLNWNVYSGRLNTLNSIEQVTFVDWKNAIGVIKGVAGDDAEDWRHPR